VLRSDEVLQKAVYSVAFSSAFKVIFFAITIFAILGALRGDGVLAFVYADYRSNLIFVFLIFLFNSKLWSPEEKLKFIVAVMVLIALMDSLTLMLRPFLVLNKEDTKEPVSIVAPAILSIYYLRKDKFKYAFFFFAVLTFEAAMGFFRNYYLITLITGFAILILIVGNLVNGNRRTKLNSMLLLGVIVLGVTIASPIVYNYWMSDESRMIHSVNRSVEFFSGEDEEKERMGSIQVVISRSDLLIVPHGLGWRSFTVDIAREFKDFNIISSMDSCIFYVGFHYGILILVCLLIYLCMVIGKFLRYNYGSNEVFPKWIKCIFLMFFLFSLLTQSVMFTMPQAAFVYALLFYLVLQQVKINQGLEV